MDYILENKDLLAAFFLICPVYLETLLALLGFCTGKRKGTGRWEFCSVDF